MQEEVKDEELERRIEIAKKDLLMAKMAMEHDLTPDEEEQVREYLIEKMSKSGIDPEMIEKIMYAGVPKAERRQVHPVRNSTLDPKVGRNEPCPCGSGKKFKKCHG